MKKPFSKSEKAEITKTASTHPEFAGISFFTTGFYVEFTSGGDSEYRDVAGLKKEIIRAQKEVADLERQIEEEEASLWEEA